MAAQHHTFQTHFTASARPTLHISNNNLESMARGSAVGVRHVQFMDGLQADVVQSTETNVMQIHKT